MSKLCYEMLRYSKKEIKVMLRRELKQYEASFSDLTLEEHKELREWVTAGYSVYDNPLGYADGDCRPMDFVQAARLEEDICKFPEDYGF